MTYHTQMSDNRQRTAERRVTLGQRVFDGDGNELGRIRGLDENGFYVTTGEQLAALSVGHDPTTRGGEKELLWRCWECGELGKIADILESCPACGAPKEEIYYWQED